MRILIATGCLCVALAFAGCGGGGGHASTSSSDSTTVGSAESTASTTESSKATKKTKPKVTVPKNVPANEFAFRDVEEGSGAKAQSGDKIAVQYVGVDYKTGKEFDSSWSRNEPLTFTLGRGEVIEGWDRGLVGMKVGGRRELVIPAKLAYGSEGTSSIAPNETLVFTVDLLAIE